jgi:iron(III) transport system substrate-binding protein
LAFLTSAKGQEIIAHSDSYEYPIASGVTTAQPETPFDQLRPNDITIAELGTGAEAIRLLQEAQLL